MTIQTAVRQVEKEEQTLLTGEDLLELGGLDRCELVEGIIVEMSPTKMLHGRLTIRLGRYLDEFVERHDLGAVGGGETGIYIRRDPDTIRAADVLFISHERLQQTDDEDGFLEVAPEIVVEILSPSERWTEVRNKIRDYFEAGVVVVVTVEPEEKVVSVFRSPTELRELRVDDTLAFEDILPGFSLPLSKLFDK